MKSSQYFSKLSCWIYLSYFGYFPVKFLKFFWKILKVFLVFEIFPINFWKSAKKLSIFFWKIFEISPKSSWNNSKKFLKFFEKVFEILIKKSQGFPSIFLKDSLYFFKQFSNLKFFSRNFHKNISRYSQYIHKGFFIIL